MNKSTLFGIAFSIVLIAIIGFIPNLYAQRTDGAEGSEYTKGDPILSDYGFDFGIDIGSVFTHTARHSNYDTGIGVGAHVEYFIDDYFALNLAFAYSHHSGTFGIDALNQFYLDVGPRARLIYDPMAFFLSLSPGFVFDKFGNPISDSAISFMIDFGAGMDLLVHKHITMGLTYKYHLVFDQNTSTAGIGTADFQSLMLKIDLVF